MMITHAVDAAKAEVSCTSALKTLMCPFMH